MPFTEDQILQLAPDEASKKAGQQLANNAKWVLKCAHPKALWGDCQGSGKNPYRTMIDLQNIAFKCSCPSRKFPCKHGLGLFLLYANNESVFTKATDLTDSVEEWLSKREARSESQTKPKTDKPVDEQAQQKRIAAREKKVAGGIQELQLWLKDVIRTGIMQVPQNPYQFTQNIATRMVDAQSSGLANLLRKTNNINFYQDGWQKELTCQLSNIYFLCDAYSNKLSFDDNWQKELNTLVGWNTSKEEVLSGEAVLDHWQVLSKTTEYENNLTTERIYFYGIKTNRFALLLNFYPANQLPQHVYTEGGLVHAELCFYPSIIPSRALVKEQHSMSFEFKAIEGFTTFEQLLDAVSTSFSTNPFQKQVPAILSNIKIVFDNDLWFLQDEQNHVFAITNLSDECWNMLAISKANAFSCFVIYENKSVYVHTVWYNHKFYSLR